MGGRGSSTASRCWPSGCWNETDDVNSVPVIHHRYIVAFIYPITATIRDFLDDGDHSPEEVDAMFHAWFKSVTLQVALWSHPYTKDGDW